MNWNTDARTNKLVGKTFYRLCDDDPNYFSTIYIHYNPFTNSLRPMTTTPIYGTPPPGMEPIPPTALRMLYRVSIEPDPLQDAYN